MSDRTGPLNHLTIIDCTMALSGPFGTALLADLGANVIKVESRLITPTRAQMSLRVSTSEATSHQLTETSEVLFWT